MPQLGGYGQKRASSSLFHLITVSFPSRGSKLAMGQLLFFTFQFEQAGVSFMRPICSFTSFLQCTYRTAYGNVAQSQFPYETFPFIPRRIWGKWTKTCMCLHLCSWACVCVEEAEQGTTALSLSWWRIHAWCQRNHSEDELSARPEVQTDPTPNSCVWAHVPAGYKVAMADPGSSCLCLASRQWLAQVDFSS